MAVLTACSVARRIRGAAGLLAAALFAPHGAAAPLAPDAVFQRVAAHVVALELADEEGKSFSFHTAIAVGGGRFVATCELLSGVPRLFLGGAAQRIAATRAQRDPRRNLCLLEAAGHPAGVVASPALPRPGARVYAVSNALGLGTGISEGVVSGVRNFNGEDYIQFTAPIAPGSEGGGLFDAAGEWLGVIDFRRRDGQNVNFAAPARWVDEIVARQDVDQAQETLRDQANVLLRRQQWPALLEHAATWTATHADDAEAWLWLGAAAEWQGDMEQAERGYRQVLRLEPESYRGGLGLARLLLRQTRAKEARQVARALLAVRREDAEVWVTIGEAELALGDSGAAEQALRRGVELSPWSLAAYRGLAAVAEQRGDADALLGARRQLAALQPDSPEAQLRLAAAYLSQNRPARALVVVERVLQGAPEHADAWFWKGASLVAMERPQAAIAAYRRSLAGQPRGPAWVWGGLGDIYYNLQLWREAVAAYRESVKLAPGNPSWRRKLGLALKDSLAFDEAMALFQDYAKAHPNEAFGWRQIGFVHAYRNETEPSIGALQHALSIDPKQAKVWLALAEQYYKLGRRDELLRAYGNLRPLDREMADNAYLWLILPSEAAP